MIPKNSENLSVGTHIGVPTTNNIPTSQVSHQPTPSDLDPTSTDEKPDDIECEDETMDAKLARRESFARSKTLVLSVLISVLALCGMGILFKSSCGGSLSLKLVPPELQLNTGSCVQVEQTPEQTVTKN
jgi:hypothetical protein